MAEPLRQTSPPPSQPGLPPLKFTQTGSMIPIFSTHHSQPPCCLDPKAYLLHFHACPSFFRGNPSLRQSPPSSLFRHGFSTSFAGRHRRSCSPQYVGESPSPSPSLYITVCLCVCVCACACMRVSVLCVRVCVLIPFPLYVWLCVTVIRTRLVRSDPL